MCKACIGFYATGMLDDGLTFGKLFEALKAGYFFSGEYNL
jgi:hypothetical protein